MIPRNHHQLRSLVIRAQRRHHYQGSLQEMREMLFPQRRPKSTLTAAFPQDESQTKHDDHTEHNTRPRMLDLSDSKIAYESKSTSELLRAMLVYQLCGLKFLLDHAEIIMSTSRCILGDHTTDNLLKATLFGHFCAGESEQEVYPVMKKLKMHGVCGILDYVAEARVTTTSDDNTVVNNDYEAACDAHLEIFRSCIQSVHKVAPDGFAALKVTALGNSNLLERMSIAIQEAENLLAKFDLNKDGVVSRKEFEEGYRLFFHDGDEKLADLMDFLDPHLTGNVDYITWSKLLTPRDLPKITASCRDVGPLSRAALTPKELELMEAMFQRAHSLVEDAIRCGTRVMIDAEQLRFQPAIDNLVLELQQKHNSTETTNEPIVFNTYQCYLKDTMKRLRIDMERSERFGFHFGVKMVRGAYMESEKALAATRNRPSPIHDTIEETHCCYNDAMEALLGHSVETDKNLEVVFATHNQESIEKAITLMDQFGIAKNDTVRFAQLQGMSDAISCNLGKNGYRVYKYVPYGPVKEAMPYLVRRAQENSAIAGNASREIQMLQNELSRRLVDVFQNK